jgi:hypothetical protein
VAIRSFVWYWRWPILVLLCLIIPLVAFLGFDHLMDVDTAVFLVVGRGALHGQLPYVGLWDNKPPGIYLISVLANLFDRSDPTLSLRVMSALSVAGTAALLGWFVARITRLFAAGSLTALFAAVVLSLPFMSAGGGMTELFACLGMSLAFVMAVLGQDQRRFRRLFPLLSGIGLGWAINTSLLSLGILPALLYLWLRPDPSFAASESEPFIEKTSSQRLLAFIWVVTGLAIVGVITWGPVLLSGAAGAAIDALGHYNALYHSLALFTLDPWVRAAIRVWWLWLACLLAFLSIGVANKPLRNAVLLWLAGSLAWLIFGERLYPHYLLVLVPPLSLLGGLSLGRLWRTRPSRLRWIEGLVFVPVILLGAFIDLRMAPLTSTLTMNQDIAAYVDAHSSAGDLIYVWGLDADLYTRSDRSPAGRFFYLLPLITPDFGPPAADALLASWRIQPPALIVDISAGATGRATLAPLLLNHAFVADDGRDLSSDLNGLRAFVRGSYRLATTIDGQPIYQYVSNAGSARP